MEGGGRREERPVQNREVPRQPTALAACWQDRDRSLLLELLLLELRKWTRAEAEPKPSRSRAAAELDCTVLLAGSVMSRI